MTTIVTLLNCHSDRASQRVEESLKAITSRDLYQLHYVLFRMTHKIDKVQIWWYDYFH